VALLSLAQAPQLDKECIEACAAAIAWLSDQQPMDEQSIATLSMLVIALEHFVARQQIGLVALPRLLQTCRKELSGWLQSTAPSEVNRSLEGTDYLTPDQPDPHRGKPFQFLLYVPHCLAAIAILSSPSLQQRYDHRQFVQDVVTRLTKRICDTGKFVAGGRQMVSTVESLWIVRLLNLYIKMSVSVSRTRRILDSLRRRRLLGISVFISVLFILIPMSVIFTDGTLQAVLGVFSSIVIGLATGVVASLWVDWLKRQ
jgi:hypothetical protein